MEIANLLKTYDSRTYYLNTLEEESIIKFCESTEWFDGYDKMIDARSGTMDAVKECVNDWFAYVNRDIKDTDFSTDILAYIASDEEELKQLKENAENDEIDATTAELVHAEDDLQNESQHTLIRLLRKILEILAKDSCMDMNV